MKSLCSGAVRGLLPARRTEPTQRDGGPGPHASCRGAVRWGPVCHANKETLRRPAARAPGAMRGPAPAPPPSPPRRLLQRKWGAETGADGATNGRHTLIPGARRLRSLLVRDRMPRGGSGTELRPLGVREPGGLRPSGRPGRAGLSALPADAICLLLPVGSRGRPSGCVCVLVFSS